MVGCSILGCKKRSERKIYEISFHTFPTDPGLRIKWISATGRENWVPSKHGRICSKHFNAESIIRKGKINYLMPCAVPTMHLPNENIEDDSVEIPSTSSIATKKRKLSITENDKNISPQPKKTKFIEIPNNQCTRKVKKADTLQNIDPSMPMQIVYVDIKDTNEATVKKLEKQKAISANRLNKLRAVRESRRRLIKKVAELENILVELRSKSLTT